ncbi:hypothetical protein FLAG1_08261 [Fusarium langsethiae]|uniref:Zn(2)-C6 fungal-type domain-containing protein n=1 Tax=Fusarium langsethiae TaxID=179993 RepID=A0A0N0DCY8_FUSLA|nr:hypothetical protein FLAG1_08261 [Fusarium langsethiae]GKU07856.1 unnamed protein product [Fusarium langsethiae]GKU08848.1 unnamed protein product [Fusarium langsethiae]
MVSNEAQYREHMTDHRSTSYSAQPRARKKRIPTSCGSCRQSKAKCDGSRPCSRCQQLQKTCNFVEKPKEPHELRIEALEKEIESLRARLSPNTSDAARLLSLNYVSDTARPLQFASLESFNPPTDINYAHASSIPSQLAVSTSASSPETSSHFPRPSKRPRSSFETETPAAANIFNDDDDLNNEEAGLYFNAFFSGCDRYVPVFDPRYDSLPAIRSRSDLLFTTICSVGCRVLNGTNSRWRTLALRTQRMLNAAIANPATGNLETVQALLVQACYAGERAILIAIATRMAMDLGFTEAYDTLVAESVMGDALPNGEQTTIENSYTRMRKARVWLHLLVLSYILHVDAGGVPTFKFRGASRRCRILLQSPFSTGMDHYLFAQVELNVLRAKIYASLPQRANLGDNEIMDLVRDAKLDIDVWFHDWIRISQPHHRSMPWFVPNLSVQRCWADNMALCRAVRAAGVENVNVMSVTQKTILDMTKTSLKQHLDIIIQEPRLYLKSIRYAMDFVWAKNTFCCLLLLKLSALLPEKDDQQSQHDLVAKASILLNELETAVVNGLKGDSRSNTSVLYLQLLKLSIQKYKRGLNLDSHDPAEIDTSREQQAGYTELESFVPDQFVFEWDFPGLTLFSSPINETTWLNEFLTGAQDFGEHGGSINWALINFSM